MAGTSITPRHGLIVGLLALLPLSWYGLESSLNAGIVSAINVLIILAVLFVAFTPVDGHDEHDTDGTAT